MRTTHYLAAAAALSLAALGVATGTPSASRAHAVIDPTSPIKHVVVIYQENHTFDEALGQLCQTRTTPCNRFDNTNAPTATPYDESHSVTLYDGKVVPNSTEPDLVPNIAHSPVVQDHAMQNKWDTITGCTSTSSPAYGCIVHVDPANIPNLTALANKYVVSDQTFAAGDTASFGAHINLAAGSIDGFYGANPVTSKSGVAAKPGWGCQSNKDALWGSTKIYVPSCVPDQNGFGPYWNSIAGHAASPVPYLPTIMQSLESVGLSWHMYQGDLTTAPTNNNNWSVCSYFWWCTATRNTLAYNSSDATFQTAAANGTLPSLSLMNPVYTNSQHNGYSMKAGDNYIGSIVKAVQASPEWNSTAIFITYDDCGCFYDHVKPPAGAGLRNPMVIVSPYAKAGFTDSTVASQPYSMLNFIDHTFGLPVLTTAVTNAYDYSNSFDFTQTPLTSATPMVHQHISAATKQRMATYSRLHGNDPT